MKFPRRIVVPPPQSCTTLAAKPPLAKHQTHRKLTWWHRVHPHTKGKLAEYIARTYFTLQGYRRLPTSKHQLAQTDILLQKHNLILIIEVKARTTQAKAHQALHPSQRQRLHAQARKLAARHPNCTVRVDALFLFLHPPFLEHIPSIEPTKPQRY
ncbi:MAG: hypothetical protein EBQ80_00435 [Proteobacteria bacterium]|nr:hypothetical protein [Pseudomonadota bacterium]